MFYSGVGSVESFYKYFIFKVNNFFLINSNNLLTNPLTLATTNYKNSETYFLNETFAFGSFGEFSAIYTDNYVSTNLNTLVSISRTLFITYYYYYIITLYLLFLIPIIYIVLLLLCFIIRFKTLNKYEQHSFKKRYALKPKINFNSSDTISIFLRKKVLFEGVFYSLLRRDLRKSVKRGGVNKI